MTFLNESDFQKIEQIHNIQLPLHFKIFHLEKRDIIERLLNLLDDDEKGLIIVFLEVKRFIEFNKDLEEGSYEPLKNNKLCIGMDIGGNEYFIDITPNSTDETIYQTGHGTYNWSEVFDEERNDFRWETSFCQKAKNLESHVIWHCEIFEELVD